MRIVICVVALFSATATAVADCKDGTCVRVKVNAPTTDAKVKVQAGPVKVSVKEGKIRLPFFGKHKCRCKGK